MSSPPPSIPPSPISPYTTLPTYWTANQWATLYSISSALISPLSPAETEALVATGTTQDEKEALRKFAGMEAGVSNTDFREALEELFGGLPEDKRGEVGLVLRLLDTQVFTRLFTFSAPFRTLSLEQRQELLQIWLSTPEKADNLVFFPPLRLFATQIFQIVKQCFLRAAARESGRLEDGEGTVHKVMGYKFPRKVKRELAEGMKEMKDEFEFLDLGKEVELRGDTGLEFDVVVVGSGPGGGIVAEKAASVGLKVLVVEKGGWLNSAALPQNDSTAFSNFQSNLLLTTDSNLLGIITATTFGGSGAINWSACFPPQAYVRKEWAEQHGLKWIQSPEFQDCIDTVMKKIGASPPETQNHRNALLLEGARKLGYAAQPLHQNLQPGHNCGGCGWGCSGGPNGAHKLDPTRTTLLNAHKLGAKFAKGFEVERVLFQKDRNTVKGIFGHWTDPTTGHRTPVTVRAKRVVVSAGAINTPLILLRSRLSNYNIGRHLHLHPTCLITSTYPTLTHPQDGNILTCAVTEFENHLGTGYGTKLECLDMNLPFAFNAVPYSNPATFKAQLTMYKRQANHIVLLRDRTSGRVYPDPKTGGPKVAYDMSVEDTRNMIRGIIGLVRILYTQGALTIVVPICGLATYVRPSEVEEPASAGFENPSIATFIKKLEDYEKSGVVPWFSLGSAHAQGAARMGKSARDSVVDEWGRVWGKKGLYVADSGLLPSASGANPQVTTLALSERVARGLGNEVDAAVISKAKL